MRKHKNKIIIGAFVVCILAFVYWWGGNSPELRGWEPVPADTTAAEPAPSEKAPIISEAEQSNEAENMAVADIPITESNQSATEENKPQKSDGTSMTAEEKTELAEQLNGSSFAAETGDVGYSEESGMEIHENTGKDQYQTDPVPVGKPIPVEPEEIVISDKALTCTLSVRCDTILDHIAWLDKEKVELVPKDGVIYAEQSVTFYEGESVFNLLMREMKRNKIHMEFENTPIYHSAYIEGIGNLYEFDCGELSGWMYSVNGWFPNYGCSRYQLKAGDKVEWVYTCNLGGDVGGSDSARNGFDQNE